MASIARVVGSIIGGIALSAIILILALLMLRRRRKADEKLAEMLNSSDGAEVQVLEGTRTFISPRLSYPSHTSSPFEHSNYHNAPISASHNPPSNITDPTIPLGSNPTTSLPGYTQLSYTQPPSYRSRSNPDRTRRLVVASAFASSSSPRPAPAVETGSGPVHGAWLIDSSKN
jgi:cell division septation protein DedD